MKERIDCVKIAWLFPSYLSIYTMNRNSFPDSAAAAFGRSSRAPTDTPSALRSGFSDTASAAFGGRQQRNTNNFTDAFGRGSTNGFDSAASAAFGKKPSRRDEAPSAPPPARSNTLGFLLNQALGEASGSSGSSAPSGPSGRSYGGSALAVQRRKAEEAEKAKKADISNPDAFPTLGKAIGGSVASVASVASDASVAPTTAAPAVPAKPTFAELMRRRAAEEAAAAESKATADHAAAQERRMLAVSSARSHTFIGAPRLTSSAPRTGRFGYGGEDDCEGGTTPPYGNDDDEYVPATRKGNTYEEEDEGEHNAHLFRGY